MAATRSPLLHFESAWNSVALLDLIFLGSFSQFVALLYLLTYVGALTNGLTLVITGEYFFHHTHTPLSPQLPTLESEVCCYGL